MKQRRLLRFHGLKRPRVRQTWNKYNLFNLFCLRTPMLTHKTFFQQKWAVKALTRGYHGEHIKENQWERMFSRRSQSVVNMDPRYMARHNGSEQAAGRGSGLKTRPVSKAEAAESRESRDSTPRSRGNMKLPTPHMQMVFAPMERRLDIAIFRALFASSARQARQFVLHGAVTVNGKKMVHPSYLLNPGDMFQVDIERVMMATGKPKRPLQNQKAPPSTPTEEPAESEEAEADAEAAAPEAAEGEADTAAADAAKEKHMATLKQLKSRAKDIMTQRDVHMRAKQKKGLRKYLKEVKTAMDSARKSGDSSAAEMSDVEAELTSLLSELSLTPAEQKTQAKKAKIAAAQENGDSSSPDKFLTDKQRAILAQVMRLERTNPYDSSKPYATPWSPRDWMSPFAFIPRYLEVNQRICAAVYLRHPVARAGLSEVPTPFSPTLSQLAFNWYLRRG